MSDKSTTWSDSDTVKLLAACAEYRDKLDELERENAALRAELEAQAVVNGKGGEREAKLLAEVAALREWVKEEGKRNDICTYGVLKEVCEDCQCGKRKEAQP